jgi:hypothetical protein
MIPITLIETDREDFDGPVVELWREDSFVGMVFFDGTSPIVQIYPDGDDDVHDLEIGELQVVLDTAVRIVDPSALDEDLAELREAAKSDARRLARLAEGGGEPTARRAFPSPR